MIVLGVTGSIGMGKSSVCKMLAHLGVPSHDADEAVHDLLEMGSDAWPVFAAAFPYFSYPQIYGRKNFWNPFKQTERFLKRSALGELVFEDEAEREKLEGVLHPFVKEAQNKFLTEQRLRGVEMAALDVPLLFETGADKDVDYTIVVSAPEFVQRQRVMARPSMSEEKFVGILARQMQDGEKQARADFVVHSGLGRAQMMKELKGIVANIREQNSEVEGDILERNSFRY